MSTSKKFVTILGAEGSGKTTLSKALAHALGGVAMVVPEWPSFQSFLSDPARHAYRNQVEAMDACLATYRQASILDVPVVSDTGPDRVHSIHSWMLRRDGYLSDRQWRGLELQYEEAMTEWPADYVYLHATEGVLLERIAHRGRPEDLEHNRTRMPIILRRWGELLEDAAWRANRNILELDGALPPAGIAALAQDWVTGQTP